MGFETLLSFTVALFPFKLGSINLMTTKPMSAKPTTMPLAIPAIAPPLKPPSSSKFELEKTGDAVVGAAEGVNVGT